MSVIDLILILFGGLIFIFGFGWAISRLLKIDKYLEKMDRKSSELTISSKTREM